MVMEYPPARPGGDYQVARDGARLTSSDAALVSLAASVGPSLCKPGPALRHLIAFTSDPLCSVTPPALSASGVATPQRACYSPAPT